MEGGAVGHNFERDTPRDHLCQVWLDLVVSDWLLFKKIFSSETAWQNGAKLGRKHLCKILYKGSSFGSIQPTNMAIDAYCQVWFHLA
jgi:hypothetical protein